jgi:hypothetical protein
MNKYIFIIDSHLVWKACETHFQQTYVNGFWFWIESYIREFRESKIYDIFTQIIAYYRQTYKAKQYINNTVYIHNGTSLLKYALRDTLGISKGCQQVGKAHNNG